MSRPTADISQEEKIIIKNLLSLLMSRVPTNVYLGIQIAKTIGKNIDVYFAGGIEYFEEHYKDNEFYESEEYEKHPEFEENLSYSQLRITPKYVIV